jgi:hypothetical protein
LPIALVAALAYALTAPAAVRAAEESGPALFATPEQALAALKDAVKGLAALPDAKKAAASPEEAAKAKEQVDAALRDADAALRKLFGSAMNEIANPDPVQRGTSLKNFAQHLAEFTELSKKDDQTVVLRLGKENWPFPIPMARKNDKWFFDADAGKEEILNRRIGRNELSAIEVCHAYVKAQREYALSDAAGNGIMEYAQKMRSTPAKRDGLYWEAQPGEKESPFGPLVAKAHEEGYGQRAEGAGAQRTRKPFHGYFLRMLTKQGKNAPGGKYDYIINDHLVAGFALLAYPAQWGNSGVMTFMVNQQGKVYQKNLGGKTAELVEEMKEYNPDETWTPVTE